MDPPFSHMDLISCRNLLIYLNSELQKKLLPLFHYTLNEQGFLFLGSSETIGEFTDLFATVDRKNKLYQRKTAVNPYRMIPGLHPSFASVSMGHNIAGREMKPAEPLNLRSIIEMNLLAHFTPTCVLIK